MSVAARSSALFRYAWRPVLQVFVGVGVVVDGKAWILWQSVI
jgi:hypothetical protein